MEELNFTSLAPRCGTRPLMAGWSDIGTSQLHGGAISWGSIWSGLKNFGSSLRSLGTRAWNSSAGQQLRNHLKDTKLQDKIVEGISTGIHGAVDLANQEISKAIHQRLDQRPTVEGIPSPVKIEPEKISIDMPPPPPLPKPSTLEVSRKRPAEEDLVITTDEPPPYDQLFPSKSANQSSVVPVTSAVIPASALAKPASVITKPSTKSSYSFSHPKNRGWQGTLNSIVGLGVRTAKRRRCY